MARRSGIEIEGMDALIQRLGSLEDRGKKAESAALRRAGDVIQEAVKREAPVRSGELRDSIKRSGVREDSEGKYVLVWPSKYYAHMVEFGTVKMRANPFMGRGYAASKGQAYAVLAQELRRRLGL